MYASASATPLDSVLYSTDILWRLVPTGKTLPNGSSLYLLVCRDEDALLDLEDDPARGLPFTIEAAEFARHVLHYQYPPSTETLGLDALRAVGYEYTEDDLISKGASLANLPEWAWPFVEEETRGPVDARRDRLVACRVERCAADATGKRMTWEDFPIVGPTPTDVSAGTSSRP